MALTFWETAIASGIGSAFGAGIGASAAFLFNRATEARKQREREIEAGNVALAIFRSKLLDVRMYENGWMKDKEEPAPSWYRFGNPRLLPEDLQRVDISSLGFLLTRGHAAIIADVRDAEHTYYDLMGALRAYRDCYEEKLIPAMHDAGIPESLTAVLATHYEARLPRSLTLQIDDLYDQLDVRFAEGPKFIARAASNLHRALRDAFPNAVFESPEPKGRLAAVTPPTRKS